ncbi:MAG: aminomethyl-transferring glycine dehydrogenase subunit GcvPB [Myxococcales bacterium]|nr:aminomethyl-transferring glycine dehydrogenase subunit GcvPB [Myxococcales bacterium]
MNNRKYASLGVEVHESLIFERSLPGVSGIDFFEDQPDENIATEEFKKALGDRQRNLDDELLLPQISEPDAVRHYTRLSKKNFSIDANSYPLGSCTMKYNPKVHEWAARMPGISELHPYFLEHDIQPALEIYYELQEFLAKIGGFDAVSLAPSAGAQGEFAGLAMINKALKDRGENRHKILVPKSAHGTNPATAAYFSYEVISLDIGQDGRVITSQVAVLMDDSCAGIMLTNPNTLGIFESDIASITQIVHERGGYVYGDGANLNALMGLTRPGDWGVDVMHFNLHKTMTTPHGGGGPGCGALGAAKSLAPYLPIPIVKKNEQNYHVAECPQSIGRIRSFFSNFAMVIRAWCYIKSLGSQGLKEASLLAILNANYIRAQLEPYYHLPYKSDCLHEVVFSDKKQNEYGVNALDIAKRIIDFGIHPPTMYFPLNVKGALMIEPTETESLYDLNALINAFIEIAKESKHTPDFVKNAPHNTSLLRPDEVKAARNPILSYQELQKLHQQSEDKTQSPSDKVLFAAA